MRSALRHLLFAGIVGSAVWVLPATSVSADSAARALTREQIRSMPILERPNRIGHFYGNTVRRRYHRHYGNYPAASVQQNSLSGRTNG